MILENSKMKALFDEDRLAFTSIRDMGNEDNCHSLDFLLTPEEFPQYDVEQGRWLGNVFLTTESRGIFRSMNTDASKDSRKVTVSKDSIRVTYETDSNHMNGIRDINLTLTYELKTEGIYWSIEVGNPSENDICIRKLGIPLLMNQYFRGGNLFQYEKCVLRHTCISNHHSYIYWSKSSGRMPVLLFQALGDTPLNHFTCDKKDSVFGRTGSMGEAFEGCFFVYPIHEKTDSSHLTTSELTLKSGGKKVYRFYLGIAENMEEMNGRIVENGGITVKALPGMCAPIDEDIHLMIESNNIVELDLKNKGDVLCETCETNGLQVSKLRLGGYGVRDIWLKQNDTVMKLQLFGMEPPGEMIKKQAKFIAENQFETNEADPCYHGLLMWDMTVKQRINSTCNPFGDNWFAGGSDEIGLVSGLFLSGKNVYRPEEKEIRVLNSYVRDFIEERLTEQPGYKVHRMVPWFEMFEPWAGYGADDAWRAFNYVHVINTFINMYWIAGKYSYDFLKEPAYYARQAYAYTKGMFSHWMFPNGVGATEFANMGELHIALSLTDILRNEGLEEEAEWTENTVKNKAEYFARQEYPYGSEMAYDSTAYEAVYAYGKAIGDKRIMKMTMDVVCANRGKQPIWYLYQTDLRQMGDSSWNVSYMTQLGAYPIFDWLFGQKMGFEYKRGEGRASDLLETWYASYLAGWSIYNSGGYWSDASENEGAAGWIIDGDVGCCSGMIDKHGPYLKGMVAMSGEGALGFYGALQIAAAVVMNHPVLGRYGFGCRIFNESDTEIIIPTDGLGVRVYHLIDGWMLEMNQDSVERLEWDGNVLRVFVKNLSLHAHELAIRLMYRDVDFSKRIKIMKDMEIIDIKMK
jgi:hypothetical protein